MRVIVLNAPVTTLRFYRYMRRRGFTRTVSNFLTFGYAVRDGAFVAYGLEGATVATAKAALADAPGSAGQ